MMINFLYSEELSIDYGWDKDEFNIPENVLCLCEKPKCRKFLMRSKNRKNQSENTNKDIMESQINH